VGHSYYDCQPLHTYNQQTAIDACLAYAEAMHAGSFECIAGTCSQATQSVCFAAINGGNCTTCWNYGGTNTGATTNCGCPPTTLGMWQ